MNISLPHRLKIRPPSQLFPAMVALYLLMAVIAATQAWMITGSHPVEGETIVTKYNNYVIFRQSFHHLLNGEDLYVEFPDEHWDLFKYSPAFALFFGLFAWLPDLPGLMLWNLVNAALFLLAVAKLPLRGKWPKALLLLLAAADAMTSLQNSQSNLMLAGLLLLGFTLLEKGEGRWATLCLVATFFIKIFGIAALAMVLFYPKKIRNILWAGGWMLLFAVLPAVVTGWAEISDQYLSYWKMLKEDQSVSLGISVMGLASAWLGVAIPKFPTALAGFILLMLPAVHWKNTGSPRFRVLLFSALLVWMVIFNHKAESPTFIIATTGIYFWFAGTDRSLADRLLVSLVVVFTSLSATDLFPAWVRDNIFEPYHVKAIPCLVLWFRILAGLYLFPQRHTCRE